MNFLYIPKHGRYRYIDGNPFEFISSVGCNPIYDYFSMRYDLPYDETLVDRYFVSIDDIDTHGFVMTMFSSNGKHTISTSLNKTATSICHAYRGNGNVYDDAVIYKIKDNEIINNLDDFNTKLDDITKSNKSKLGEMIRNAIKWF